MVVRSSVVGCFRYSASYGALEQRAVGKASR